MLEYLLATLEFIADELQLIINLRLEQYNGISSEKNYDIIPKIWEQIIKRIG